MNDTKTYQHTSLIHIATIIAQTWSLQAVEIACSRAARPESTHVATWPEIPCSATSVSICTVRTAMRTCWPHVTLTLEADITFQSTHFHLGQSLLDLTSASIDSMILLYCKITLDADCEMKLETTLLLW